MFEMTYTKFPKIKKVLGQFAIIYLAEPYSWNIFERQGQISKKSIKGGRDWGGGNWFFEQLAWKVKGEGHTKKQNF